MFFSANGRVTGEEVEEGEHIVRDVFPLCFLDHGTTVPVAFDVSAGSSNGRLIVGNMPVLEVEMSGLRGDDIDASVV